MISTHTHSKDKYVIYAALCALPMSCHTNQPEYRHTCLQLKREEVQYIATVHVPSNRTSHVCDMMKFKTRNLPITLDFTRLFLFLLCFIFRTY